MADNTLRSVHINEALTNMSVGWMPKGLIAERVVAVVPVKNESDFYYIWNKGDALRRVDTRWGDGTRANQVDFGYTIESYLCHGYGLETKITERQRKNADSILRLELAKTRRVQGLILLDQENRVADLLTATTSYASTNRVTLSGTDQWNHASFAGNIEKVFDDAKEAARLNSFNNMAPDLAIIPAAVAKVIKRDAMVRELIRYTQSDLLVNGDLPPTLWNMQVVSPAGVQAADREVFGADAPTPSDIWGKHVVLTMRPEAPALDTPAHCYIFRAQDVRVEQWRETAVQSDFYRVSYIQTEKVVSNVGGYLIKDVIS
jgi:hypothetical protein